MIERIPPLPTIPLPPWLQPGQGFRQGDPDELPDSERLLDDGALGGASQPGDDVQDRGAWIVMKVLRIVLSLIP